MVHTGDGITHPVVMVEAANLLQIIFFRGQKHATPISFGTSISNNRFIGGFLINWMIYTPIT